MRLPDATLHGHRIAYSAATRFELFLHKEPRFARAL
jgi:hypothetical protein